jgi:antitoxin ParD1/3/4
MPRSLDLGDRFEALVDRLVGSGRYSDASEAVREGLRLLEDLELVRKTHTEELRRMIEEALNDRDGPAEKILDRLRRRYREWPSTDDGARQEEPGSAEDAAAGVGRHVSDAVFDDHLRELLHRRREVYKALADK